MCQPAETIPDVWDQDVDYGYLLDDDPDPRPDPRSRRQPGGVPGWSQTGYRARLALAA